MPEKIHTQVHPRVMTGLQADRPVHPDENGLVYVSETDISVWDAFANGGAGAWRAAADTPAAAGWPDYVVSKGDPVAPFSTIQSAIDAATLAGVEALVLVHPGTYVEDITMAARVRVIGLPTVAAGVGSLISSDVIIQGTVTIDNLTDGFTFLLANIQVQPASGAVGVHINTAANNQRYVLQNCAIVTDNAASILCDASGSGPFLEMRNCRAQTANGGSGAIVCSSPGVGLSATLEDCYLYGQNTASVAVAARTGAWHFSRVTMSGSMTLAGSVAYITDSEIHVSGANGFTLDGTSVITIIGLNYSAGLTDNLIAGTGTATKLQGLASIDTGAQDGNLLIASTVVQDEPPFNPRGNVKATLNGAGPFTIVPVDEVYITPSGNATATLPAANTWVHGARTTIKTNGAKQVTLAVHTGDSLDNAVNGTYVIPASATGVPLPAIELQCDANLPGWYVVSKVVVNNIASMTAPGAYPYMTLQSDDVINVDTSGGARTIHLNSSLAAGTVQTVVDHSGNAATGNITIDATSGAVHGPPGASLINVAYDSRTFQFDGTNWTAI